MYQDDQLILIGIPQFWLSAPNINFAEENCDKRQPQEEDQMR